LTIVPIVITLSPSAVHSQLTTHGGRSSSAPPADLASG
jgi:hypothetical protein